MALSIELLLFIALSNFAVILWIAHIAWQQRSLRLASETSLRYTAYRQADLVLFAEGHQQLLEAQEFLESSIHGTTATVRAIHLGIAAIPFGILEAIPVTRDTTKVVRGTHNLISDVVYSSISVANRAGGVLARKGIGEISGNPDEALEHEANWPTDKGLTSEPTTHSDALTADPAAPSIAKPKTSPTAKKPARPPSGNPSRSSARNTAPKPNTHNKK